ncbi:hypothetical protein E2C01_087834 [Portunus trituberculatus]|uniref:Uncharacterized protein n=1 Tax=Portunus trituberculatus TaxID=210409 RepID=A0A5B7JIB7_PORTR|nr:hypothetical protein [Portunus trituberculatus]
MSSSNNDTEAVVALLAYRKIQRKEYYNSFLGSQMCCFSLTNSIFSIPWRPHFQSLLRDVTK